MPGRGFARGRRQRAEHHDGHADDEGQGAENFFHGDECTWAYALARTEAGDRDSWGFRAAELVGPRNLGANHTSDTVDAEFKADPARCRPDVADDAEQGRLARARTCAELPDYPAWIADALNVLRAQPGWPGIALGVVFDAGRELRKQGRQPGEVLRLPVAIADAAKADGWVP